MSSILPKRMYKQRFQVGPALFHNRKTCFKTEKFRIKKFIWSTCSLKLSYIKKFEYNQIGFGFPYEHFYTQQSEVNQSSWNISS